MLSQGGNTGPYRAGISPLWDYGAHDVAMALKVFRRRPVGVEAARIEGVKLGGHTAENYRVQLRFEAGQTARFEAGNAMAQKVRITRVVCPEADLVYDDLAPEKLRVIGHSKATHSKATAVLLGEHEPPLARRVQALVDTYNRRHRSHWSAALGVAVTAVLERCEQAL